MAFKHGVYVSEVETALTAAPAVDASLPFVIGASKNSFGPKSVSSWRQFVEISGIDEAVDAVPDDGGWFELSLVSFAYFWFRIAGRGECIMQGISSNGADEYYKSDLTVNNILGALDSLDTIYEQTRRTPSILCVPYYAKSAAIQSAMASKMSTYGGRFKGLAVCDTPASPHCLADQSISIVSDPDDALAAKQTVSPYLAAFWPCAGVDNMRFDLSTVVCAVMNRVDALNGDLPFVSPSNKNAYATGLYVCYAQGETSFSGCSLDSDGAITHGGEVLDFKADTTGATCVSPDDPTAEIISVRRTLATTWVYSDGVYTVTIQGVSGDGTAIVGGEVAAGTGVDDIDDVSYQYHNGKFTITPSEPPASDPDCSVTAEIEGIREWVPQTGELVDDFSVKISWPERYDDPVFMNRDDVNTKLDGNGIVSALNTADGWVIWGNNTTAYPGNLDVKDYMIPIRRMFNYTQNLFQVFAAPRIDNPLNRRQLEGVVNSFNQVLASLQGFGALNAASVAVDDERNTTAQLIAGVVFFKIKIAPPPPMQVIEGVFEYDVVGFEASIA